MAYTMSFDASVKLKRGNAGGLSNHIARELSDGKHSNPNIDSERTHLNKTFVLDESSGKHKPCEDTSEISGAVDCLLKQVKKPLRKDAVVMRPLILQLDPEWYKEHTDPEEQRKSFNDMLRWTNKTFGMERVAYYSLHMDEGAPHLHIGLVPVTADGRLSQKDFFANPTALRKMHEDLRNYMTARGYDIKLDNKKEKKYVQRLNEADYRALKQEQAEAKANLEKSEKSAKRAREMEYEAYSEKLELEKRERELDEREHTLSEHELSLKKRAKDIRERENDLSEREHKMTIREMTYEARLEKGIEAGVKAELERRRQADERIKRAERLANDKARPADKYAKQFEDRFGF